MNMDLLRDKSWRDVTEIWLAYHRTRKETLSAVIPLNQFNSFYNQSIKYPMVLYYKFLNKLNIYVYIYTFSLFCHFHAILVDTSSCFLSFSITKNTQHPTLQYT